MGRYRKVDPRIWNDEKFRKLDDRGKLVFFFLLTHPNMTAIGAMRGSVAGLAAEIGWDLERFMEPFMELFRKGMCDHDESGCLIWLPNFLKYNSPDNPNMVKAWGKAMDFLPECELLSRVVAAVAEYAKQLPIPFQQQLPKPFGNGMPILRAKNKELRTKNKGTPPTPSLETESQRKPKHVIPDWIPSDSWLGFVAMRQRIKKPLTERGIGLIIGKLERLRANGLDVGTILDESTMNSWAGVFALKDESKSKGWQGLRPVPAEYQG